MDKYLEEKLMDLRQERNAVILAHNYQPGDIQDLADFTGDSLGLSRQAAETSADVIVFCGVKFMAETASVLSPDKTELLPDKYAGCPMADMITVPQLRELKQEHPDAVVVCYVNSPAEVKAESDYCCTSSNAAEVVESIPQEKEIIFVPDRHLGETVSEWTDRKLTLWAGYCPTHVAITERDIIKAKQENPDAVVLAHPECRSTVKKLADKLLSTGQMLKFVRDGEADKFIIATEKGIVHALIKSNPDAEYIIPAEKAVCPNMKKITLEKVITALEEIRFRIEVPDTVSAKARIALKRMVEVLPVK